MHNSETYRVVNPHSDALTPAAPSAPLLFPELLDDVALLRVKQVLRIFPISKSWWYDGVKKGKYPQGVKLSPRVTVWTATSIKLLAVQLTSSQMPEADKK